jgi:hypothetical protein
MLVRIHNFERREDGVVVFVIQVEREICGLLEMWETRRRFSEFRKLHVALGDKRPFPSRLVLCRSSGWLITRMMQLEDWLRGTVSIILGWEPLADFLRIPVNSPKEGRLHQLIARFRPKRNDRNVALFNIAKALAASRVNAEEEEEASLPSPEPLQYTTW